MMLSCPRHWDFYKGSVSKCLHYKFAPHPPSRLQTASHSPAAQQRVSVYFILSHPSILFVFIDFFTSLQKK